MGRLRWGWVSLALLVGCSRPAAREPEDSGPVDAALARRGRTLFQRGRDARGAPLVGMLAPEQVELSGEVAACARCHGPAGRGSREGGVEVPDITPGSLGHARAKAVGDLEDRSRPAYTRAALLRAMTGGVSASGRPLSVAMPRYVLDATTRGELLAYLRQLGESPDPGVSATTLTVGASLPLSGRLGPLGREAEAVVRAVFEDVNASGGLFRRRLELVVEDETGAGQDATTRLLDRGVLALVASLRQGPLASDDQLSQEGVPLVLPLALGGASIADDGDSPIFFLYPDEPSLARLAVQHLTEHAEPTLRRSPLVVAHTGGDAGQAWLEAVKQEARRRELAAPIELLLTGQPPRSEWEGTVRRWASAPPPAVLYAGSSERLSALLRAVEAHAPKVKVLAPASLAEPSVVGVSAERVRFLYPAGLGDRAPSLSGFADFLERHQLAPGNMAVQLGAYASARVLVEALTRLGADVTRAGLVQRLEALRDFDTGVSPPITFGINRRVGVQGAQLASLDVATGRLVPASDWIPLSP